MIKMTWSTRSITGRVLGIQLAMGTSYLTEDENLQDRSYRKPKEGPM
jgi:hypothetical protein